MHTLGLHQGSEVNSSLVPRVWSETDCLHQRHIDCSQDTNNPEGSHNGYLLENLHICIIGYKKCALQPTQRIDFLWTHESGAVAPSREAKKIRAEAWNSDRAISVNGKTECSHHNSAGGNSITLQPSSKIFHCY